MHLGTPFSICIRVRIIIDAQNKRHLIFRHHESASPLQHGRAVPFISSSPGEPLERYYFCNNYFIPLTLFIKYLEATKDLSDEEVQSENSPVHISMLEPEDGAFVYKIQAWNAKRNPAAPYPAKYINLLLDKCIKKLHLSGDTNPEIADLLGVGVLRVRNVVDGSGTVPKAKKVLPDVGPKGSRRILVPEVLRNAPEYAAIKKAANYARVRAAKMGLSSTFLLGDVVPTLHDIQGNSGRLGSEGVVPKVCPVLRLRLNYNTIEDNKALNTIRVWRKTPGPDGKAPLSADNVVIMSVAATYALEGAYATRRLEHLDSTARNALADWQAKHGTREVPREKKVGRPRKVRN